MMMIVPLAHERDTVRRWPILTLGIMVACLLVHTWHWYAERAAWPEVEERVIAVAVFHSEHSYLPRPALLAKFRVKPPGAPRRAIEKELARDIPPELKAAAQQRLDALVAEADAALHRVPAFRFGYIPAEKNYLGLFTSQFMHGGYLHLFFNMWFLWLAGTSLEDRWGRIGFSIFYLLGGAAAALSHAVLVDKGSDAPLIGASGSVAACMGAFLVLFARTRIEMLLLFWLWFRPVAYRFGAPAWVMLGLWVGSEALYGALSSGTGVAHWAHVGGFAFGAAVAGGLLVSGIDKRLDAAIDEGVSVKQDSRLLRAMALSDEGKPKEALAILRSFSQMRPKLPEVQLEFLRAARLAEDRGEEGVAYGRLVNAYLSRGDAQNAAELVKEAQSHGRVPEIPAAARLSIAKSLREGGELRLGEILLQSLADEPPETQAHVDACLALAAICVRDGRTDVAADLFERVATSPFASLEQETEAKAGLAGLGVRA